VTVQCSGSQRGLVRLNKSSVFSLSTCASGVTVVENTCGVSLWYDTLVDVVRRESTRIRQLRPNLLVTKPHRCG